MRNNLVILFSMFLSFESIAQNVENVSIKEDSIVEFPDIKPSFPGGEFKLQKFFAENLKFLVDCMDSNFYGLIDMKFIVEKDGSISTIQINEKKLGCAQLVKEATRVLMLMSKWIPGEVEGVKKSVHVRIPLNVHWN